VPATSVTTTSATTSSHGCREPRPSRATGSASRRRSPTPLAATDTLPASTSTAGPACRATTAAAAWSARTRATPLLSCPELCDAAFAAEACSVGATSNRCAPLDGVDDWVRAVPALAGAGAGFGVASAASASVDGSTVSVAVGVAVPGDGVAGWAGAGSGAGAGEGAGAGAGGAAGGCSAAGGAGLGGGWGAGAGGAAGAGGGWGALRDGSRPSGSTYVSLAPNLTPRCTYGTSCSASPLGPGSAIGSPSETVALRLTRRSPRCVSETL
jgi:hypothetical protein